MIHKTVLLQCSPQKAFTLFTEHASDWWPPSRRHTGDPRSQIKLSPEGRFWERASDGREVEMGRVKIWAPPDRLVLDFFVGTDAEHPTEVKVSFSGEGTQTRVTIDHGPLPVSDALFHQRAPRYDASWTLVLEALAEFASK